MLIAGASVSALVETAGEPPIGLGDGGWSEQRLELPSEWAVLLYTDGIVEGRVGQGPERLGEQGLHGLVGDHLARHADWREQPAALLDDLIQRAEQLNGRALIDDIAMILVGVPAEPASGR